MSREELRRLEHHVTAAAGRTREVVEVGSFRLFIARDSDLVYFNYAVPTAEPADWAPAIAALEAAFRDHGRVPRLEFFEELWPTLAPALDEAGFQCAMAAPVLTAAAPPAGAVPLPPGMTLRRLEPDDAEHRLDGYIRTGYESFGTAPPETDPVRIAALRSDLAAGALLADVVESASGDVAAVASIMIGDGIGELAGVGTRPDQRRRGLALALCRHLLDRFFAGGGELVWLSAGDDAAYRLYRRLGFSDLGRQLNYSRTGC